MDSREINKNASNLPAQPQQAAGYKAQAVIKAAKIKAAEILGLLTNHEHLTIVDSGDAAIKAAVQLFNAVLIPEEGGWLSYKKLPKSYDVVKCDDSRINLTALEHRLKTKKAEAFLYQNPGGYFAEQPAQEIYQLCSSFGCKVILDVSGALGTKLCNGNYADILVGSFGSWKLADAGAGGFISARDKKVFEQLKAAALSDGALLQKIARKLVCLNARIEFLSNKRKKIINDLFGFKVIYPGDLGFVAVIAVADEQEKENLISYCVKEELEWTECPRYIRVNRQAISIEVKRLQQPQEK